MNVWKPEGVELEPSIEITAWKIYEVKDDCTRHLIGRAGGSGRVSSAIKEYLKDENVVVTRSGRRYSLIGESEYDADAAYVWLCWQNINNVTSFTDVSEEYSNDQV